MGNHIPRQRETCSATVLESLVQIYFRLNGYFCVPNYLQHRVTGFGLHTESDVLALRMPHQHELLENEREQTNDPMLVLSGDLIDCVIAEVKEPSVEFNKPVRGNEGIARIAACLRMFGVHPRMDFAPGGVACDLADDLHKQINERRWTTIPQAVDEQHKLSVRMIVFAPAGATCGSERRHLDLQHVLSFTRNRMRPAGQCAPYRDPAFPSVSYWRGTTRFIVESLDDSHEKGETELGIEELIRRVQLREAAEE